MEEKTQFLCKNEKFPLHAALKNGDDKSALYFLEYEPEVIYYLNFSK